MKLGKLSRSSGRKTEAGTASESGTPPRVELTIEELAKASHSTARNIRAYQDRGLIPPPSAAAAPAFTAPNTCRDCASSTRC